MTLHATFREERADLGGELARLREPGTRGHQRSFLGRARRHLRDSLGSALRESSLIDPGTDLVNLGSWEWITARGHPGSIAQTQEAFHQETVIAVTRDHKFPGDAALQNRGFRIQAKPALRFFAAVTG